MSESIKQSLITISTISYKAASLPAPLENLKAVTTSKGVNFVVTGLAYPNGTAYNPELAEKPLSSARVYDSLFVRHWDTYITPQKSAIFSGSLKSTRGVYSSSGAIKNLFGGVKGLETPVQPFGSTSDFDLSSDGTTVAFLSKAPDQNPANTTASYIYVVPHSGSKKPVAINLPSKNWKPEGASANPVFSPDGKSLAYLQQDLNGYESDKNKLYVYDLKSKKYTEFAENWDRAPGSITYSKDGKTFLLITEEQGREKVFTLSTSAKPGVEPKAVTGAEHGSVSSAIPLSADVLLLSTTSIVSSIGFSKLTLSTNKTTELLSPNKVDAALKPLSKSSVSDFWFDGTATKVRY